VSGRRANSQVRVPLLARAYRVSYVELPIIEKIEIDASASTQMKLYQRTLSEWFSRPTMQSRTAPSITAPPPERQTELLETNRV
jgi:hypothetical protein